MAGMIKLLYTLKKEFLLITRDVHAVTVLFVMPAVFIMIMSLAMRDLFELHSSVSIDVLAVNRDAGKGAEAFVKAIEGLPTFKFHLLEKDATTERIRERMLAGDYKFALIVREGLLRLRGGGRRGKGEKPLELLVNPSVTVQTQMVLRGALEAKLAKLRRDAFIDRLGGVLEAAGIDRKTLKADDESPVEVRYAYREGRSFKVPSAVQQSVPAWLVFSMFFIVIPISNTFISERGQGTLMRLKSMNVSRISLIVGKMVPYLFINAIQVAHHDRDRHLRRSALRRHRPHPGEFPGRPGPDRRLGELQRHLPRAPHRLPRPDDRAGDHDRGGPEHHLRRPGGDHGAHVRHAPVHAGARQSLPHGLGAGRVPRHLPPGRRRRRRPSGEPGALALRGGHAGADGDHPAKAEGGLRAMKGSLDEQLKTELKRLIVEECDITIDIAEIGDDDPLFGSDSRLGLDSIDALQISIAIQNKYNLLITDSKQMRKVMRSMNTFADFIQPG